MSFKPEVRTGSYRFTQYEKDLIVAALKGLHNTHHEVYAPTIKALVNRLNGPDVMAKRVARLEECLEELYDMFEDEIDADYDNGVYIPNRAMKVCDLIDEARKS